MSDQGSKPPPAKTIMGWSSPVVPAKPQQPAAPQPPAQAPQPPAQVQQPPVQQPPVQQPQAPYQPPAQAQQPAYPQQPPHAQPQGHGQPPGYPPQQAPAGYPHGQQPSPYPQPGQPQAFGGAGFGGQPHGGAPPQQAHSPHGPYGQQPQQHQQPQYQQPQHHQPQHHQPQHHQPQHQGVMPGAPPGVGVQQAPGFGAGAPAGYGGQSQHQGRPIPHADATAGVAPRVRFVRLTYLHLFGAILVFAGLEWCFFEIDVLVEKVTQPLTIWSLETRFNWGIVLVAFMAVSWIADMFARRAGSKPLQYLGLGIYVLAEAVIFIPLLFLANYQAARIAAESGQEVHTIRDAAVLTLALFGALTASVFLTKKDFSFLRSALAIASAAAMAIIALSLISGFNLGLVFSIAMVILAAGYVLYYTSQVLAHYHPEQYVAASLALFASIALMFWYVIRILMALRR